MGFFTHQVIMEQIGFFHSPGDSGADGFLDVFADPPGVLLLIAGHRDQALSLIHI